MHAVGDGGDWHLTGVEVLPQTLEHVPRDLAMEHGDAVGPLAQPEAHHGHVELARIASLVVLSTECQNTLQWQTVEVFELVDDQLAGEPIDAGRHRSVGS